MNWFKKKEIAEIKTVETSGNFPENLDYLEAISLVTERGYTKKTKLINIKNKSEGVIFEHPEHADLRVDFKTPKQAKSTLDKISSTAYHNNDNPIKNSKDDKFWDERE